MSWKVLEIVAGIFTAVGTVSVAVLAIWGDYFRYKYAGPALELRLNDERGNRITRPDGSFSYYFHLQITNHRQWAPAKDVRVLVDQIARRGPDASFLPEPLVYPVWLYWTPANVNQPLRTIFNIEMCDLGFLDQKADRFKIAAAVAPAGSQLFVVANGAIRIRIVASGQSGTSKPLFLEIAWDGRWPITRDEVQKHLVVKEISSL